MPGPRVESVFRLVHAAGLADYARLVIECGAEVVHTGPGLETLPLEVERAGGGPVRWIGSEEQARLG
jgi:hypothetical protein